MTHRSRAAVPATAPLGAHATRADHSDERRIGQRIEVQPDGCWLYNGPRRSRSTNLGHGTHGQYSVIIHRWTYETLIGPIPEGHDLRRTCPTPGCCNPAHRTPVLA